MKLPNDFRKALEATPRDWLTEGSCGGGIIRRRTGYRLECPLTAPVGMDSTRWLEASKLYGINCALAEAITDAADLVVGHDPELRADIAQACGV